MNSTLRFYKNLIDTSLYLLLPVGLVCILSGLLFVNEIAIKNAWLINRTTDIPFFMVFTTYLFSTFRYQYLKQSNNPPKKIHDVIILTSLTLLNLTAFFFDIFFTNQLPT